MEIAMRAGTRVCVLAVVTGAVFTVPAGAQTPADFYKGKTISILMGTGPGGSYDLYGRTIAEHLGRHIPGRPNIVLSYGIK
jgi:tripartite-type tricarboxylate transporter receptor subunit TctC